MYSNSCPSLSPSFSFFFPTNPSLSFSIVVCCLRCPFHPSALRNLFHALSFLSPPFISLSAFFLTVSFFSFVPASHLEILSFLLHRSPVLSLPCCVIFLFLIYTFLSSPSSLAWHIRWSVSQIVSYPLDKKPIGSIWNVMWAHYHIQVEQSDLFNKLEASSWLQGMTLAACHQSVASRFALPQLVPTKKSLQRRFDVLLMGKDQAFLIKPIKPQHPA